MKLWRIECAKSMCMESRSVPYCPQFCEFDVSSGSNRKSEGEDNTTGLQYYLITLKMRETKNSK